MRGKTLENVMMITKMFLGQVVKEGDQCIDATTGNGHDTLNLCEIVGESGHVFGFDVQEVAIESTKAKLTSLAFSNHTLICDGHEKMLTYIEGPIDFVIFNLGYLPRADKSIKTHKETTLPAIEAALTLLKPFGVLWVVVYPGHEEGYEEACLLNDYFSSLVQQYYSVMKLELINQKNNPPYILAVEKKVTSF